MDNTGKEKVLYSGEFDDVRWKYMSNDGSLYFVDLYSLYVLKPHQRPQMIVEYLHENRFPFSFLGSKHSIYGIWTDDENNIYTAIYGGIMVKKITSYWEVTPILKSNFLWSPVNGVFDKNNNLWIMENTLWGKIRVRKIEMDRLKSYNTMAFIVDYLALGLFLFIAGFVLVKINRKRNVRKARKSAKSD